MVSLLQVLGPNHLDVADTLNLQGKTMADMGNLTEARICYEKSLEIKKSNYGHNKHATVSRTLMNKAMLYQSEKKYEEAYTIYEECKEINAHVYGQSHSHVVGALRSMAGVRQEEGRVDLNAAEQLCKIAGLWVEDGKKTEQEVRGLCDEVKKLLDPEGGAKVEGVERCLQEIDEVLKKLGPLVQKSS